MFSGIGSGTTFALARMDSKVSPQLQVLVLNVNMPSGEILPQLMASMQQIDSLASAVLPHAACVIYQQIKGEALVFTAVLLQAIRVQTSPGHVETAVMHVLDIDCAAADVRLLAMHNCSPIHTYMFDSKGLLLQANTAAHWHKSGTKPCFCAC